MSVTTIDAPHTETILSLLPSHTYAEIAERTGWSRGKIWRLAVAHGARKHEARISERARERKARQAAVLQELLRESSTTTADVLDGLEAIPDDSIHLTVTSPPYNIGRSYGGGANADRMRYVYYHGWLMQIVSEVARVTAPGGVICFQVGMTKDDGNGRIPLDILLFDVFKAAGLTYQNRVSWPTHHGLTPSKRLAERYETILIFAKGEPRVFNAGAARTPQKHPDKRAFRGAMRGKLTCNPLGAHPTDVWNDVTHLGWNNAELTEHPAQYPEALARRCIGLYSNPGDTVLDPFSGSGTTNAVCIKTGRAFIGFDLFYDDVRAKRLSHVFPDTVTPLPGVTAAAMAVWAAEARRVDAPPLSLDFPA